MKIQDPVKFKLYFIELFLIMLNYVWIMFYFHILFVSDIHMQIYTIALF